MVIIDEKQMLPPPPPYVQPPPSSVHAGAQGRLAANGHPAHRTLQQHHQVVPLSPPPFPRQFSRDAATLSTLPPHILLYIVHMTIPQEEGQVRGESKLERQRKVLYWMTVSLRMVSRPLYIACMHVLRSTYLPAYMSLIRPPYTSDPFPLTDPSSSYTHSSSSSILTSPVTSIQRETAVLDLFLCVKVREDVYLDDSELHLEREESYRDLFDLMQPRARLEDLLRQAGAAAGLISVAPPGSTASVSASSSSSNFPIATPPPPSPRSSPRTFRHPFPKPSSSSASTSQAVKKPRPIPFAALSCSFSSRTVGLILTSRGGRRTIVEVSRGSRDEPLEVAVKRLVRELRVWTEEQRGVR